MRTRTVMFIALMFLTLPLLAQEQTFEATIQFSGEKAETISSFSWGVASSASKTAFSELRFTKPVTQLSSTLFLACTAGKHFSSAVIKVAKKKGKNQEVYLEVKLEDLMVSSYHQSDSTDTTALNYGNVEFTLINP